MTTPAENSALAVWDGLYPVMFTGQLIAESSTEKTLRDGQRWEAMDARTQRLFLRWVEMTLYKVDPGQRYVDPDDPAQEDLIRLPDGGYFLHIVGQSVCYHAHDSACNAGVELAAGRTEVDALPCPDCRPPQIWSATDAEDWDGEEPGPVPLTDPHLLVDVETPRHTLHRAATAREIVRKGRTGGQTFTIPATRLLEKAKLRDPAIAAVFAPRPAPPRVAS